MPQPPKKKKSVLSEGGLTPLGKEAKDSLEKNGAASAARTVARGIGKEFDDSFGGAPGRALKSITGGAKKEPDADDASSKKKANDGDADDKLKKKLAGVRARIARSIRGD